jgi:hypothetical protein
MIASMNVLRENPLNSRMADGVTKVGFRKWYERELLSSHAHMVLAFLSIIALMASMEAFRDGSITDKLADVMFVVVCALVGLWALRRYLFLLMRAEVIANQAVCPECGDYGRFTIVAENRGGDETQVCCRKCTRRWLIRSSD